LNVRLTNLGESAEHIFVDRRAIFDEEIHYRNVLWSNYTAQFCLWPRKIRHINTTNLIFTRHTFVYVREWFDKRCSLLNMIKSSYTCLYTTISTLQSLYRCSDRVFHYMYWFICFVFDINCLRI